MYTPHDSRDPESQTEALRRGFPNIAIDSRNYEQERASKEGQGKETAGYGDSSATYWELYASEAKISDQKFVDTLISDTKAMSILNGIFSSIIASFLQQTSQALQPNNNQETVCLLSQLVPQANSTQPSSQFCQGPYPGEPSKVLIRSNILLVTSFFLAMAIVLACGLIHQWCDEFMKNAYPRTAPHKRGRVRTYLFQGLNEFYVRNIMYGVRVVLVVAVILFFCGVSDYLYTIHPTIGWFSWSCVIAAGVVYAILTIFPLIFGNCPYRTAMTTPLQFCHTLLTFSWRNIWRWFRPSKGRTPSWCEVRRFDETYFLVKEANERSAILDPYAMEWLFTDDDFSDTDMDKYLEGLPGYIQSLTITQVVKEELPKVLTAPYILRRIGEHLLTCVTATEPREEARIKRVLACVESLRAILQLWTTSERLKHPDEAESLRKYTQNIVNDLNTLCGEPEEQRDLRAFCVRALAFQGFLTKDFEPSSKLEREGSTDVKITIPDHCIPLYTFFYSIKRSPSTVSHEEPPDDGKMRQTLLNDGPFINLTLLAEAIYSHGDYVDRSTLSMCWKTLDILRAGFRITRTDISSHSLKQFDDIHNKTRRRVEAEEPGVNMGPLLQILDAVDGGRRLSMVFQAHPNTKYHSKSDLVFGKGHLRNPDLFQAFANCLPHFVTNYPEKSVELMEGLVLRDHLWTSLQAHLSNSLAANTSIPAILRVFETCCTVIDAAFVALANSKVDWRAPDFGSLAHYFELFVTDCFQGIFIERAIGFRVGLIKARFCRTVLAQFLDEFRQEGTVIFRSHWDVASLARVLYSLGVGDKTDLKFWKSFVDGGPVGAEFMAKTHAALHVAKRDGPLLNFCRLGHLGMMAVPFKGSGLEQHRDFKKLLDLMQNMTDDLDLPLTHASTPVWEELRQLRDEVFGSCERLRSEDQVDIFGSSSEDIENMNDLLEKIDTVYDRRPSSTEEHYPANRVRAQVSGTSVVVQPNPPSRGPIPGNDSPGYASTSASVVEGLHDNSPTQEVDSRGVTPPLSNNSRGELANVYRAPYPLLPSQIGPKGKITLPFSASFLPRMAPHSGSADMASPSPSNHSPSPPMRYNSQHRQLSVYYPPKRRGDQAALAISSDAPSPSLPHTEALPSTSSPSSKTQFCTSSDDFCSGSLPASPEDKIK